MKTTSELGWAALDISGVNPDHNGIYTLKIINSEGEAASSASIKVICNFNPEKFTTRFESIHSIICLFIHITCIIVAFE